jgi:putative component of membrane protein insertase Oxa1/YidC/SpoIIIJ protein YidD
LGLGVSLGVLASSADVGRLPADQFATRAGIHLVRFYQQHVRPFTSKFTRCRLTPSCSQYALAVLEQQGAMGVFEIRERLALCDRTRPRVASDSVPHRHGLSAAPAFAALGLIQAQPRGDEACAACLAATGGLGLLIVATVGFGIALLVWVARDAKCRGVESPILWMLLVFFTSFVGLIIYLLARPGGNLVQCEHCRNKKLQYMRTCPHCGNLDPRSPSTPTREVRQVLVNRVERTVPPPAAPPAPRQIPKAASSFCSECGAKVEAGAQFCEECGAKLT